KEHASLNADFVFEQRRAFISPDGSQLIFVIPANFSRYVETVRPTRIVVVSVPNCIVEYDFEIGQWIGPVEMSPNGRFIVGPRGGLWKLNNGTNLITGPATQVVVAPNDSSLLKTDGANSSTWQLIRSNDMNEIAQGIGGSQCWYASNSQWVAISTHRLPR